MLSWISKTNVVMWALNKIYNSFSVDFKKRKKLEIKEWCIHLDLKKECKLLFVL